MVLFLISIFFALFFTGCTQQTNQQQATTTPLYVVMGTGYTNDNRSVYVDIQNIDNQTAKFAVEFHLTYSNDLGSGNYPGGTSYPTSDEIHDDRTISKTISSHETGRIECPIVTPNGYALLGGWDYSISGSFS